MSRSTMFLLGLLLPGCRNPETGPNAGPVAGPGVTAATYVLRHVAGEPLPAVLLDNEHATIVALADTLYLESDGSGLQVAVERSTDKGSGASPVVRRDERPFTYSIAGSRISVSFECNDVIIRSCAAPPHLGGVLMPASLVLDQALHYRAPLHYDRIGR